jgi:hypothetical protein
MPNIQTCPTCEAKFIDGQHFWSTGKKGNPLDLAGLVCNVHCGGRPCINPLKGEVGGQTWESRAGNLEALLKEHGLEDKSKKSADSIHRST